MDRTTELELLDELVALKSARSFYLDEGTASSPVELYFDTDHFAEEQRVLFRGLPQMVAHASELGEPLAFLTRTIAGMPLLLTRDNAGEVHAFLNVCRHRGTQLVGAENGCRKLFSCPYHAWTWNHRGELLAAPHLETGFPGLNKSDYGLKRLSCVERYGFIWVALSDDVDLDIDTYLAGLAPDFEWLKADDLYVFAADDQVWNVNWKIIIEGGIEAYHFKIAHKNTIGPHFQDNLSSYRRFGSHLRSVLPRTVLNDLENQPRDEWDIRKQTNLIYSILPASQLLVQEDHIAWIQLLPLGPDQTRLCLSTLVPKDSNPADSGDTQDWTAHWEKNHTITRTTLTEDFELGEGIQKGLRSGANTHLTFGRYEGALDTFSRIIDEHLSAAAA